MYSAKKAQKHAEKLLARISKSKGTQQRRLAHMYLKSVDARIWSAKRILPGQKNMSLEMAIEAAENADAFWGKIQGTKLRAVPKNIETELGTNADFRPVCIFNFEAQLLQRLVADVVEAEANLAPCQFLYNGGKEAAIERVLKAFDDGFTYACHLDIKNFYSSFDGTKVHEHLGLPKEVVLKNVIGHYLTFTPIGYLKVLSNGNLNTFSGDPFCPIGDLVAAARSGIPQGSISSPIVAETLLAPIFGKLTTSCVVVNYADNTLILGKDENEVEKTFLALRSLLEKHPVGPLLLSKFEFSKPGVPIRFLGYEFVAKNGSKHIGVQGKNIDKINEKLRSFKKRIKSHTSSLSDKKRAVHDYKKVLDGWCASFSFWKGVKSFKNEKIKKLDLLIETSGIPI